MSDRRFIPPRWVESLLELWLPTRARDEVVGDLREEYVESILPRHGRLRADLWYARHVLSFLPSALRESRILGKVLIFVSGFTMICMLWLALMEITLRHPGYGTRTALDISFAMSCLATAVLRMLPSPRTMSERCLQGGGFIMILFGAQTFVANARKDHFEGFVFVISLLLMVQGLLMAITLGRRGTNNSGQPAA